LLPYFGKVSYFGKIILGFCSLEPTKYDLKNSKNASQWVEILKRTVKSLEKSLQKQYFGFFANNVLFKHDRTARIIQSANYS
jgi:hypothetical protein